jgi:hypothetical protein
MKRKNAGILAKFRDDKSLKVNQAGDLPINVLHLSFEKISAITGDYWLGGIQEV